MPAVQGTSYSISVPSGDSSVALLAITDTSGNAAASVPSSTKGTWTLVKSGAYCALWLGTGLSPQSYAINVTCTSGTTQGAFFVPVFNVTGNVASASVVTQSGTGISPSPSSLTAANDAVLVLVAGGSFTTANAYIVPAAFGTPASIEATSFFSVGAQGDYNGIVSVVPVKAGSYSPGAAANVSVTYTAIACLLT